MVVGGLGSLPGAIFGAIYYTASNYLFPAGASALFATGLGLLIILLVFPAGFGGLAYDLRDAYLRWVANRRGLVVPSLLADRRVQQEEEPWKAIEQEEEKAGVLPPALSPGVSGVSGGGS